VVFLQPIVLTEVEGGTLVTDAGNLGGGALGVHAGGGGQLGIGSSQESICGCATAATMIGPDSQIMKSPRRIKIKGMLSKIHAAISPRVWQIKLMPSVQKKPPSA
jgi:hypothetical protein